MPQQLKVHTLLQRTPTAPVLGDLMVLAYASLCKQMLCELKTLNLYENVLIMSEAAKVVFSVSIVLKL